jgi:hypothetical protein
LDISAFIAIFARVKHSFGAPNTDDPADIVNIENDVMHFGCRPHQHVLLIMTLTMGFYKVLSVERLVGNVARHESNSLGVT